MFFTYKRILDRQFKLPKESSALDELIGSRQHFFTFSARGGIEALILHLELNKQRMVTLLPAFSAQGIIQPFKRTKADFHFYKSDGYLRPDLDDIKQKIQQFQVKAVLVVHYFGYPQKLDELMKIALQNNIYIFEDCAQAFLSKDEKGNFLGRTGHISFYSLTKSLPVTDGSLFICNDPSIDLSRIPFKNSVSLIKVARILAFLSICLKTFQVKFLHNNAFLPRFLSKVMTLFNYVIICHIKNPQVMSKRSLKFTKKYDLDRFFIERTRHAEYYAKNLNCLENMFFLPYNKNYVLTGFPILVKERNKIIRMLREKGIEVLTYTKNWFYLSSKEEIDFANEKQFLNHHLLLPVNENYSIEDIAFITEKVNEILENDI